jgi:hypothetical protein
MTQDELRSRLEEIATELIEHGDAVVILVSSADDAGADSDGVFASRGNRFTRLGMLWYYARVMEQLMINDSI